VQVENPYIARAVMHLLTLDHKNEEGDTPLMLATKKGVGAVFIAVFLKIEQLTAIDSQGNTLLHLACLPQNGTILTHMIKRRLFQQIDPTNSQGATPLHFACQQNKLTAVRNLALYSANVNTVNNEGQTPLMAAIIVRNNEMCEFLIRYPLYGAKCSINVQNNLGNSALHLCAMTNNATIGRLLIEQGANPALENSNGQTAALIILENSIHRLPEYGQFLAQLEEADGNSDNSQVEEL
jgi:ankyrin repeat protein